MGYFLLIELEKNRKARDSLSLEHIAIENMSNLQTYVSPSLFICVAIEFVILYFWSASGALSYFRELDF
jgi:hypothetical protein